jgi:hypothetical protein
MRSLCVSIARDCTIEVEFDPFGQAVKVRTNWNVEVRDVVCIDSISCRRCVKGFLIVAYLLF